MSWAHRQTALPARPGDRGHVNVVGVHPLLRRLFSELERRSLGWILLRLPSSLAAPTGDVDLLVASADADALRAVAVGLGFVALPGWRSAPDLILVSYHRPSDRWLVLEVTTNVCPQAPRSSGLGELEGLVLSRRQLRGGLALPSDDDAFWLLLLHCLLDKHRVSARHRARLEQLVPAASSSPVGRAASEAAGLSHEVFMTAVRFGQWERLEQLGARLAAELRRRRTVGERFGLLARRCFAIARKPLLVPRRRGLSVALLGPNGVGKSTAATGLQASVPFETRIIYMGLWKAAGGGPMRAALEVLTRPLRIWGRYLVAQYHQLRGRLVVFDRYVYEALLPARPPLVAIKRPYFWLLAHTVPRARCVVVLDVPGQLAYRRKQENPAGELEAERKLYASLVCRVASLELIDAARDADTVRADITAIVWRELANRWQPSRSRR